jgi:cell division protein FtsZ
MNDPTLIEASSPPPRDPLPILLLAVGHAGIRLIAHLPGRVPELSYAAVDSDRAALESAPFARKVLIGEGRTGGLGCGGNPDLARSCAEAQEEDILSLLEGFKVVMIVAGLGGGTGAGAGAWIAGRARDLGLVVVSALTRPLDAEGAPRRHAADATLRLFREPSDAVLLFPLEVLKAREDPSMLLPRLLKRCGLEVGRALGGLAVLLRSGWLLPVTLQDLIQVMQRADGYCRLAAVSSDGEDRASTVLEQLFTHPLLDKGSLIAQSGGVVVGILCGPQVTVAEVEHISLEIRSVLRPDAELKLGVAQDDRFGRYLGLVLMAAERWAPLAPPPAPDEEGQAEIPAASSGSSKLVQSEIPLAEPTRGRFKDAAPTIVQGADLDTPAYIRKGLKLSSSVLRNSP